eukprot:gene5170-5408_t
MTAVATGDSRQQETTAADGVSTASILAADATSTGNPDVTTASAASMPHAQAGSQREGGHLPATTNQATAGALHALGKEVTSISAGRPTSAAAGPATRGNNAASSAPSGWKANLQQYYRYYLSPTDVDDETGDLTQRVQEAAGVALAEANERLMEAEKKVQAALELDSMRMQSQIWADNNSSEVDKLKSESGLIHCQLAEQSAELAKLQQKLVQAEADRETAVRERQQVAEERDKLMQQMEEVIRGNIRVMQREFEFDAVIGPEESQEQAYEEVSPMVRSCADGYNVCIFAYGQTGSGKTYTMEGPADNPGINTRALQASLAWQPEDLFAIAAEEGDGSWSFHVAMLEIYNESVRDLLAMSAAAIAAAGQPAGSLAAAAAAAAAAAVSVDVSGLPAGELPAHMDRVPGLVWHKVTNVQEVQTALRAGSKARATAATALNAASSRSHALVSVKVQGMRDGKAFTTWLHLVDLAGSERVDKSEVTGQQLKEAQAINKSLSALGDVIAALQRRGAHIPFRNSKLTQVLQDSLCGSSKVLLVCNLSPESASCSETLSSLSFASRAAQVELGQARRVQTATAATGSISCGGDVSEGVISAAAHLQASSTSDLPLSEKEVLGLMCQCLQLCSTWILISRSTKQHQPLPRPWFLLEVGTVPVLQGVSTAVAAVGSGVLLSGFMTGHSDGAGEWRHLAGLGDSPSTIALVVGALVLAPVTEEYFFRGFVLPSLTKWVHPAVAVLLTGLLFASAHSSEAFLPEALLGVILSAALLAGDGNILVPLLAHCLYNSFVLVSVNSTYLEQHSSSFKGVFVNNKAPCVVTAPSVYDWLPEDAHGADDAEVKLYPLLCVSSNGSVVFEKLVVEDVSLPFDSVSNGYSTGVLSFAGSIEATISSGRITGNQAGSCVLATQQSRLTLTDGTLVKGNLAITGTAVAAWDSAIISIVDSRLEGNNATNRGAGVYAVKQASVSIQDSLIKDNRAVLYGAGINLYERATAMISYVNCSGNVAGKYGGCLEAGSSVNVSVRGGMWHSNTAHWGPCFDVLENVVLRLHDGFTCSNNTATSSGGGGSLSGAVTATITGASVFSNNQARSGGALYVEMTAQVFIDGKSQIIGNKATIADGGGLWLKNEAVATFAGASSCSGNSAVQGGCVSAWESAAVTFSGQSVCSRNRARQGGCAAAQGPSSVLVFNDSTVNGNRAALGAGVRMGDRSVLLMSGSTVVADNAASMAGGGLYMSDFSSLRLGETVSIRSNSAERFGGGVVLISNNASLAQVQQAVSGSNLAPYDTGISVLTTNLTLKGDRVVPNFVSRLGSEQGVLWVKLAVRGWFELPCEGVLVQAVLSSHRNEILGVNRSAADGSVQLGIKLRQPPGCYSITLSLVESLDLVMLGVVVPPVAMKVCVRQCVAGEISTGDACEVCRKGSYSLSAGSDDTCLPCPSAGAECPGGAVILPQDGWWHSSPYSAQVHSCPNPAACQGNRSVVLLARAAGLCGLASHSQQGEAAAAGETALEPGSAGASSAAVQAVCKDPAVHQAVYMQLQCSPGYTGNLCGACTSGYGLAAPFTCHRCMHKAVIITLYVVAALIMLAVMRLQVYWALQERSTVKYTQDPLRPTDVLKPLILFCQYLLMVFTLNTKWPATLSHVLQKPVAWLWSSASAQTLSVECVLSTSTAVHVAVLRVLFYLMMPVAMVVVLVAIEAISQFVRSRQRGGLGGLYAMSWNHKFASIAFVVVFFYLPSTVRTILSLFACVPVDGAVSEPHVANAVGSYWLYDMSQQCYTGYHRKWSIGLGLPLLFLVFVLLPGGILFLLLRNRQLLNHPSFLSTYGYLYRSYRMQVCWFEAVWVCFTIILAVISVFGHVLGAYLQTCVMLLALAGMWLLLLLVRPYAHPVAGNMMLLAIGCLLATSYGAFLFLPLGGCTGTGACSGLPDGDTGSFATRAGSEVVGAVLLLLNLLFVLLVIVNLVRVIRWRQLYDGLAQLSMTSSVMKRLSNFRLGGSGDNLLFQGPSKTERGKALHEQRLDGIGNGNGTTSPHAAMWPLRPYEEPCSKSFSSDNSARRLIEHIPGTNVASSPPFPYEPPAGPLAGSTYADSISERRSQQCCQQGSTAAERGRIGRYLVGRLVAETPVQQHSSIENKRQSRLSLETVPDVSDRAADIGWAGMSESGTRRSVRVSLPAAAALSPGAAMPQTPSPAVVVRTSCPGRIMPAEAPAGPAVTELDLQRPAFGTSTPSDPSQGSAAASEAAADEFSMAQVDSFIRSKSGAAADSLPLPIALSTVVLDHPVGQLATVGTVAPSLGPTCLMEVLQQPPLAVASSTSADLAINLLMSPFEGGPSADCHPAAAPVLAAGDASAAAGSGADAGPAVRTSTPGRTPAARCDSLQSPFYSGSGGSLGV